MSENLSNTLLIKTRRRVLEGLVFGAILLGGLTHAGGQTVEAYAKPKENYNYIYTLDHEYETTLFRSEKFEPLVETEEGYIIMLQLAGKPKLVLLPFDNGDRKVAEKKFRGVGVTYTAFLSFTQGYLPLSSDQYYDVVKQEKGMLFIEYALKGFRKIIQVPESRFLVKSAFEYHLEESLDEVRRSYHTFKVTQVPPESWQKTRIDSGPGTLTESPTHIGVVQNKILANNFQSIRTGKATELLGALKEVWIERQRLIVVPILYTHETVENVYYFVKMKGYARPVLVKDFKAPDGSSGYSKVVRVSSNSAEDLRFLEISESMNVEFYPNFQFLLPGGLAAVREGFSAHYLITADGEYEISKQDMKLYNPKAFLQMWETLTERNRLSVGDGLYEELLAFRIPAIARTSKAWQSVQMLQALAHLNNKPKSEESANLQSVVNFLGDLESGASRLNLSLHTNPKRTTLPFLNECYFHYWKKAFNEVNERAAREGNQSVLKRQILRSQILIGETEHQALINFLSSQIYTYSNYLPAPLNRINQLQSNPPLAATELMVFNFPLDQSFKVDPDTMTPLVLSEGSSPDESRMILKDAYDKSWLLDIDILQYWQATIIAKKEEVYDPAFWKRIQEKKAAQKEKRLEIARKRLLEAQTSQVQKEGFLHSSEAPWVAAAVWFVVILMTNTGFFALSKAMPLRQT